MKKRVTSLYNGIVNFAEEKMQLNLRYFISGGSYLLLLNVLTLACGVALSITFANLLAKEVYGEYQFVLSILGMVSIFSLPGMNTALVQAVAKGYEGTVIKAIQQSIKWSILGSLIALLFSIFYLARGEQGLVLSFLLVFLLLPLHHVSQYYNPYLNGKKDFKRLATFGSIYAFLYTALMVSVAYSLREVPWLVATYLLANILINGSISLFTLRKAKDRRVDNESISFGKHLTVMEALQFVANYLDRILLSFFVGFQGVAIYSIAITIPEHIKDVTKIISPLTLPKLAAMEESSIKRSLFKRFLQLLAVTAGIIIVYLFAASWIIKLLFPRYLESIFYSRIFMISFISFPGILFVTLFQSKKLKKPLYQFNTSFAIIQILSLVALTPFFGVWGAILARLIARIIGLGITLTLFGKYAKASRSG